MTRKRLYGIYFNYKRGGMGLLNFPTTIHYSASSLPQTMAHETFPGHLLHFWKREQILVRKLGYCEHSLMCFLTPSALIAEGIAENAFDFVFTRSEAQNWLSNKYYPFLESKIDAERSYSINFYLRETRVLRVYAILEIFHFQSSERKTVRLLKSLGLSTERAKELIAALLRSPEYYFQDLLYPYGKALVQNYLAGPEHRRRYISLLESPWTPSRLQLASV
jgi:hypothetical protein